MPVILFLKILGGIAAVALGIFLGGGRYTQSQEEIEFRMGGGKPRRPKRHFMWLDMLRTDERGSDRRRTRGHFQTSMAGDRPVAKVVARDKTAAHDNTAAHRKAVASAENEGQDPRQDPPVQDHQGYPDEGAQ